MNALDTNTLQFLSAAILTVLSLLMFILWRQNREFPGNGFWCVFSITLTIDTVLTCFPEIRNMHMLVYFFNINASYSYFFLMLGCFQFADVKWNRQLVILLFASCFIINVFGAYIEFSDVWRRSVILSYNTIGLVFSAFAISRLSKEDYIIEKYFLLSLLIMNLTLHIYWVSLGLQISNPGQNLLSNSVTPLYVLLIMITIGLLLLSLGRLRKHLEIQRTKGINIRTALTNTVQETRVATKSKSIFLANMSHELRTPLNIILGFSDALKMRIPGKLNEKQENFVENIHAGGRRLLVLINDLLSLSNIEAGNLERDLEKIKPGEIFPFHKDIIDEIGNKYICRIHFIEDLDEIEPNSFVLARQDWIEQILVALIDNAAKYGTLNGSIWLNIFMSDNDHIRISIRDEGRGINRDQFDNVFKPFNRAGMDSRAVEGTGAGLSIVKGFVEAMDGKIEFESRKGYGSTFWFDLKLQKE